MAVSFPDFSEAMQLMPDVAHGGAIAVAVSGGPDSMALLWLLSKWAQGAGVFIHAYTVDHGLRPEAAQEARRVGEWVRSLPSVSHKILAWQGAKPESRILEEARTARYRLLADAMKADGLRCLYVAHHRDDQAETFLIRLAKGSGLDGLGGMRPVQKMESGIILCRPLLDVSKADLVLLCRENDIPYIDDPTNKNQKYLRPRLRAAQDILEEEGLSAKRLGVTAKRLARASSALEEISSGLFEMTRTKKDDGQFVFDYKKLSAAHEEIVLRVLLRAMEEIHPGGDYGPRLEKVENLLQRVLNDKDFKSATLGGCIFAKDAKGETLSVRRE